MVGDPGFFATALIGGRGIDPFGLLGVSRFWYVADEQNFLGSERFAKLGGERVF